MKNTRNAYAFVAALGLGLGVAPDLGLSTGMGFGLGFGARVAHASFELDPAWSIARTWDETILQAIRLSTPRPPVHARNLLHHSAAMYDAWASYDPVARGVFFHEKHVAADVDAARREAISYACYRVLKARFVPGNGPNIAQIQAFFDARFAELGYDASFTSTTGDSPAAIGNRIAAQMLALCLVDGSNETGNYAPNNGYVPSNTAMPFKIPGAVMEQPSNWQPLAFDFLVLQNGEIVGAAIQSFICPHWKGVTTFALSSLDRNPLNGVYIDQGPPWTLGQPEHQSDAVDMVAKSAVMDPRLTETLDISPGVWFNSPLGEYEYPGYGNNPITGEPYPSNVVKLSDYSRILAEYWADGPDSETPPGHWHVVANDVMDTPGFEYRIGGVGEEVPRLEYEVKLYLTIAGAAHDAAVIAWGHKGEYDSARPISFVRHLAELGQSSDPGLPNYHPWGMPLVDGLIEQVQPEDVLPGGRFVDLAELVYEPLSGEPIGVNDHVGSIVVKSWTGGFSAGTTSGQVTTGPLPGHVYRNAANSWTIGGFIPGTDDSPGTLNPGQRPAKALQINEIRIDQPGNDPDEYFEIAGLPGTSLDNVWYVVLGDEVQTKVPDSQGRVQVAIDLSGHEIPASGVFVVAKPSYTLGVADLTAQFVFREIGNCTHFLVTGFNGYLGLECDYFDNGVLDVAPWDAVIDSLALRRVPGIVGIYSTNQIGPDSSRNQLYGVDWILGDRWMPYQASNFVTPPFAGYTSGHSTFSRATAEAMTAITGSQFFPGGYYEQVFDTDWLRFESGPSEPFTLIYASYYDAADDAAISRIYGGIHPRVDDLSARVTGSQAGKKAAARAFALFKGLAAPPDLNLDGVVDADDFALLFSLWGTSDVAGDLNGDGIVDGADFGVLLANWG
ncbi:MAG TPA: hypothetical protein PKC43_00280 [Phycisphaerales bacterium]|nr:hypothetical protein [Phycisphaerales bacterium]HMP35861.1 hypothetical protein [Phycisphaerales bacterium]